MRRGGPEKSLAAAIAWRDAQLSQIDVLSNHEFRRSHRASNTSGAPGVLFIRPKSQPEGSWQAKIKLPSGKSIAKTFSVKKHGERGAFRLAVAAREALLQHVVDKPFLFHPTTQAFATKKKQ